MTIPARLETPILSIAVRRNALTTPYSHVSNLSSVSTDRYRSLPNQRSTTL
jgi:hypothetical protein